MSAPQCTMGGMVLVYIIGTLISLLILHFVIKSAVTAALASHYKTVRWYEKTGEWVVVGVTPNQKPRDLPEPTEAHQP